MLRRKHPSLRQRRVVHSQAKPITQPLLKRIDWITLAGLFVALSEKEYFIQLVRYVWTLIKHLV